MPHFEHGKPKFSMLPPHIGITYPQPFKSRKCNNSTGKAIETNLTKSGLFAWGWCGFHWAGFLIFFFFPGGREREINESWVSGGRRCG